MTYLDESDAYDKEKVEGWKDTIDVLLVFVRYHLVILPFAHSPIGWSIFRGAHCLCYSSIASDAARLHANIRNLVIRIGEHPAC
jgi:hypothetical protein